MKKEKGLSQKNVGRKVYIFQYLKKRVWDGLLEVERISAYPYARQPNIPISVSLSVSPDERLDTPKFYDRAGKFPRSEALESRIKDQWGTVRYEDPEAFLKEKKYLGLMKGEGDSLSKVVESIVEGLLAMRGGIDEISVAASETGYRTIIRRGRDVVNIEYNESNDAFIAYHYRPDKNMPNSAKRRMHALIEPRPDEYKTTNDLGVYVYGTENIMVSVTSKRKKYATYNPANKRVTTRASAEEFIRQEFGYNLAASFATEDEMKRVGRGEEIQFTLRFKGYRTADGVDKPRDEVLKKAYFDGISTGLKGIFLKLERHYTGRQQQTEDQTKKIAEQEWFTEVFMKAKATPRQFTDVYGHPINNPIHEIRIDKENPMYLAAAKRFLGRRPKPGEVIVLQETIVYPTVASLEARKAEYLKERAVRQGQEAAALEANREVWSDADIRAAQRVARG